MDAKKLNEVKCLAAKIRVETLKALAKAGCGHVGGALDLADLLAVLYSGKINVDPKNPKWEGRDYLVISKGHAGPVLYAALALKGFFPEEELSTLNKPGTNLPSHCDRLKTPGVDMTAGSLGQGIGAALGIALGHQLAGRKNRTFCIVGDGEMDEGSVWEIMQIAPQQKVQNFVVILDHNGLQIDGTTEEVCDLRDIMAKAATFGWNTIRVDGHDVAALDAALDACEESERPTFIDMCTVKAKGWTKYEGQVGSHYVGSISEADIAEPISKLRDEIHQLEGNM